jgi:hypothetical protein
MVSSMSNITGLLRMSYITDVLRFFLAAKWFSDEDYRAIHFEANLAINGRKSNWFESVIHDIAKRSRRSLAEVEESRQLNTLFTSTLAYVHLGSPELISIVEDDTQTLV